MLKQKLLFNKSRDFQEFEKCDFLKGFKSVNYWFLHQLICPENIAVL